VQGGVAAGLHRLWAHTISKVSLMVTLNSKQIRTLTFENLPGRWASRTPTMKCAVVVKLWKPAVERCAVVVKVCRVVSGCQSVHWL
jgi:hypothetical protein